VELYLHSPRLEILPTRKQKSWKTNKEMVGADLGAGMHQQDTDHVAAAAAADDDDVEGKGHEVI